MTTTQKKLASPLVASLVALLGFTVGCATTSPADEELDPDIATAAQALETCGGFTGSPCAAPSICVDDPRDDCDPHNGSADCTGLCVTPKPLCGYNLPSRRYISTDPAMCSTMHFICNPWEEAFFSARCGCGCKRSPSCYDDGLSKNYLLPPDECATVLFKCKPDTERFDDDCGCGCRPSE